ncbi:2Fe-2S iron-sulfur cluster-binding protein [Rhodobium gokarnense]|uniref:CDP-4-dehydro-6-deoxyglucose reductase n=1 Tax=Rhodobium gokarnense TaxID=364296 RepID=A0ABT3HHX9_9HYPH|nr:2Fe-2S iron-sulfur cluster-binding protein [Rhodobium gokarnense]MCW2310015.1 CDP-4-dehydro-6-deoxyglucose reductase [Rhodobium gokarnense]
MATIRMFPSGQEVESLPGDTVLAALERTGYALPNNCRAGACGECKVKVRSGEFDQGMVLDMALSPEDREAGFGLMCMAKPISDVMEIEWGTEDAQPKLFPSAENMFYVLTDRVPRTPSILEIRLRPIGSAMRYWPGQYVTLGDERNGVPTRCYSIANPPQPDGEITLHVTRIDEGTTSLWVHDTLKIGDKVRLSGPYGTFIGDPSAKTPVLCLAAGSGLAPILSLATAALTRGGFKYPATVLFSARTEADLYETGLLKFLEAKYRNFRFRTTLTRETGPDLSGRIPELLPDLYPDLSGYSVYIAGSPEFVDECTAVARRLGAKDDLIHTEGFVGQNVATEPPSERLMGSG